VVPGGTVAGMFAAALLALADGSLVARVDPLDELELFEPQPPSTRARAVTSAPPPSTDREIRERRAGREGTTADMETFLGRAGARQGGVTRR
jgi:hypothetical protein